MMSKFPYGPASSHILSSEGPQPGNLQFYSTTYSTNYSSGMGVGKPITSLRHKGTGYIANFRPAIYYSPKQDSVDNPIMRKLMEDNYDTQSRKDFIRHRVPDPNATLPSHVTPGLSGFAQNMHPTLPTQREVKEVHVDTRLGGSLPIYPHHRPLLHSVRNHDPIPRENAGHGPKAMTTECHAKFVKKSVHMNDAPKSCHSRVEDSGYTQACNIEPVTFRPFENHGGEYPGYMTWRPTGESIMTGDFEHRPYMSGNEPLQALSARADLSTGYVKGSMADSAVQPRAVEKVGYPDPDRTHPVLKQKMKREDPAEHAVLCNPRQYTTMKSQHYQGRQRPSLTETRSLGREAVGHIEPTGYTENTLPFVDVGSERDGARFSTHYKNRFANPTPQGMARFGHLANGGGVLPPLMDAFTKSTQVHKLGYPVDIAKELRTMDPYTARSLMKRYPYMNDNTHSHKMPMVGTF